MSLPLFLYSNWIIFSVANNTGTSAANNITAVNGMGGQASHNKNELLSANK